MKITIFTIRSNVDNMLIFAEGTHSDGEYFSSFKLEKKWLDSMEIGGAWYDTGDHYAFDEEVRHLVHGQHKHINFNLETIDFN